MRNRLVQASLAVTILGLLAVAGAGILAANQQPENRAYELQQRLRCPVCQSVSIADSPSETAQTMRIAVAEQVAAGRSDEQIINYFRARYGAWVLLDPPPSGPTLWVWVLPVAGAAMGAVVLATMRGRRRLAAAPELSAEQRDRLARALEQTRDDAAREDLP